MKLEFTHVPSVLRFYLSSQLRDAVQDGISGPEIYDRFLGWT